MTECEQTHGVGGVTDANCPYCNEPWTERRIGRVLARGTFKDALCVVPNTQWTGDEADLLVVTRSLRVVDVEIKVARADLRRDRHKDKWWSWLGYDEQKLREKILKRPLARAETRLPRTWPRRVWKHYYAMPASIYSEDILEYAQPFSGVLVVDARRAFALARVHETVRCVRRARPNPDAAALSSESVVAIARLASLRMWDAFREVERDR